MPAEFIVQCGKFDLCGLGWISCACLVHLDARLKLSAAIITLYVRVKFPTKADLHKDAKQIKALRGLSLLSIDHCCSIKFYFVCLGFFVCFWSQMFQNELTSGL